MEEKAILGVPWTVVSFGANKVIGTLTTLALARLLSPSDFGLIAIALMVVSFLYWFGGLSFANTIVLRQELDEIGQGTALTLMLVSGLLATAVAAALASTIAGLFHNTRVTGVLIAMSSMFLITSVTSFYDASLQRDLEFRRRFVALGVQTVSYAVLAVALAALGSGVWSIVVGQIGSGLLYAIALLALATHRVKPRFDRTIARSLIVTGRGFLAQGMTVFVRQNADNVTVGYVFGVVSLGFYSMAYRLGDLSYWAISDPIARVTFPAFARSRARGEDIRGPFLSVLRMVALMGCPFGVILSGAAEPFTRALFGERWIPMVGPLAVLGIWSALRPIDTTLFWLLNSIGRADLVGWISLAILVPLVPGFIVAVSVGHLKAVATVVVIDTLISLAVLAWLVRRHVGVQLRDMWRAIAPIVVASPIAWAATFLAAHEVVTHPAGVSLIFSGACGLTAYVIVLSLLERSLLGQALSQLLRVLGRSGEPAAAAEH
jgi:O-antigen/teichoic acid export membrane protein